VRGKGICFFIIEDLYGLTGTIGGEFIVNRRHSFGIDATWFRWRSEHDDDRDNALYEQYERRKYSYIDYKFRFLSVGRGYFYLNVYNKIGWYDSWAESVKDSITPVGYPLLQDKTHGYFHEPGLGIGSKWYFGDMGSGWGIDISANAARRFSVNDILEYDNTGVSRDDHNVHDDRYGFYMRVNLFYQFGEPEEYEFLNKKRAGKYHE
jgi:hypothetical protein